MVPPSVLWLLSFADVLAGAVKVDRSFIMVCKQTYPTLLLIKNSLYYDTGR